MTEPLTPIVANNQLDLSLKAWLHEKFGRTASEQTRKAYTGTITAFRDLLRAHGRDLAWVPGPGQTDKHVCQELALYAQAFAGARVATSHHKGEISPATKNQRLSILSSFYKFANQHGFPTISNPIELVGRSPVEAYATSVGLEEDDVQMRLAQIDVKTRQGLRDMALLLVLFTTGRRAAEAASLRWRHLQISKKGQVTLSFEHCKGGKSTRDMLDETAGGVLDEIEGGSERNKMPPQRQAHALPESLREASRRSRQG